jgi:hypothetical protein
MWKGGISFAQAVTQQFSYISWMFSSEVSQRATSHSNTQSKRMSFKKHSRFTKKSRSSHYYASSHTFSGNIHMPSIIARQDALVFVDKSKASVSSNSDNPDHDNEEERETFFAVMKVRNVPKIELDGSDVLVCFFVDASWYMHSLLIVMYLGLLYRGKHACHSDQDWNHSRGMPQNWVP